MGIPKDSIFLLDNVISISVCEELKKVIDEYACNIEELNERNNVQSKTITIAEIIDKKNPELGKKWDDMVFKCVNKIALYLLETGLSVDIRSDSGYQLRKIHGPTRLHTDGPGFAELFTSNTMSNDTVMVPSNVIRVASVVIALNSDYEGGEFHFPRQDVTIKLKAGQAIVFPPFWSHPHETKELNGTFRYTINTWLTM